MDTQQQGEHQQRTDQYITTEHFTLQTARSALIVEINGRTNLFIGTVSSAVVALAFVGQVSRVGDVFFTFALVLLPSLVGLGLVTFLRVNQALVEDNLCEREINRIRHFYAEMSPQIRPYLLHSTHDDRMGVLHNMGLQSVRGQGFFTNDGMVAIINSILMGVFLSFLVTRFLPLSVLLAVVCGIGAFLASFSIHLLFQSRRWQHLEQHVLVLFPSDET